METKDRAFWAGIGFALAALLLSSWSVLAALFVWCWAVFSAIEHTTAIREES